MLRQTPSEKKALSYKKDRRNNYGESDKGSRRIIGLRKRVNNRSQRKNANQLLQTGLLDESRSDDEVRLSVLTAHRMRWRKWPDAPLGEVVKRKLLRRQLLEHINELQRNAKVDSDGSAERT